MYGAAPHTTYLAGAFGTGWATAVGIAVVALIITAFWWGGRRARRRPLPPQRPQAGADSWHEPSRSETRHSARSSDAEHKRT